MPRFEIKRVLVFATVLLLLRVVAAAILAGAWPNPGEGSRFLLYYSIECFFDVIVVACVFARLAVVQTISPWIHAIAVVLVERVLSALLYSVVLGNHTPSPLWLIDYLAFGLAVVLGILFGLRVRRRAMVGAGVSS
jgi:hypothetical protein